MRLEIISKSGAKKVFETQERKIILGRDPGATCHIDEERISRKHLLLEVRGSDVYATDLGSANGTFLQNKQLKPNEKTLWPSIFPLKLGQSTTLSLLPDTAAIDNTFIRTHNPFLQQNVAKTPPPPPSSPNYAPDIPSKPPPKKPDKRVIPIEKPSPRPTHWPRIVLLAAMATLVLIYYLNPAWRAKALQLFK